MKNMSIILSVAVVTGLSFFALAQISKDNQYTSVRRFIQPIVDTIPPVIEFLDYKNGDVITSDSVDIQVKVTDNKTPSDKIIIEGAGKYTLKTGFNPIIVSAKDEAGNVASSYIVLEKK